MSEIVHDGNQGNPNKLMKRPQLARFPFLGQKDIRK
uniref:Uncharacterized protein n=1 Tax=Rhizophora mucronata TaxID=61149 RepID=A0A2P2NG40_RHIMU